MAANLQSFLGQNPQAVFQSKISGMASPMSRFWQPRYSDIYGQYMGQQAGQAMGGEIPTGDFSSFLNKYPWLQSFYSYSPQQRGSYPSRYAPPVRRLQY